MKPLYKRAVIKLTGEALGKGGINFDSLLKLSEELKSAKELGIEMILVLGGGNLFRGRSLTRFPPVKADYLGMVATVLNGLALGEVLEKNGIPARVLSALKVEKAVESYEPELALKYLGEKKIVILTGGTGLPFFTTDSAAALRALELKADVLLKATKVAGIFSRDPEKYPEAEFFPSISYDEVLKRKLEIMDLTAVLLCRKADLRVVVFDFHKKGNLKKALAGKEIGSIIRG